MTVRPTRSLKITPVRPSGKRIGRPAVNYCYECSVVRAGVPAVVATNTRKTVGSRYSTAGPITDDLDERIRYYYDYYCRPVQTCCIHVYVCTVFVRTIITIIMIRSARSIDVVANGIGISAAVRQLVLFI
jgi:hypothetical protein